jgi:hypothetical protein
MSVDPLVTHLTRENRGKGQAWLFAGICQLWIWLNAAAPLAFRFWVVDRLDYTAIFEQRFWPCMFLIEGMVQLSLVIVVWLSLSGLPRGRDFRVFSAAAAFSFLVDAIIVVAWALLIFDEYRLAVTFALFGCYLAIPAILFGSYCALVTPRPASLWIYAVTVTIALKCSAIIPLTSRSHLAFISYLVIILIALLSVVLPLRLGLAKTAISYAKD